MRYLIVTGYYPSENTAKKIIEKIKDRVKTCKIVQYEDCFCVVLKECKTYEEADKYFGKFMKQKIYCGIHIVKE